MTSNDVQERIIKLNCRGDCYLSLNVFINTHQNIFLKIFKNKNIEMTLNRDASNQTYLIDPQDVKSISFLYGLAKT